MPRHTPPERIHMRVNSLSDSKAATAYRTLPVVFQLGRQTLIHDDQPSSLSARIAGTHLQRRTRVHNVAMATENYRDCPTLVKDTLADSEGTCMTKRWWQNAGWATVLCLLLLAPSSQAAQFQFAAVLQAGATGNTDWEVG